MRLNAVRRKKRVFERRARNDIAAAQLDIITVIKSIVVGVIATAYQEIK